MNARAESLIAGLQLQPHPEGGHYREVFRSTEEVAPRDGRGARSALTAIFFLLAAGEHSRWHRVASDEIWQFCEGDPLELFWLDADGRSFRERLGPLSATGCRPLHVVPAGAWQAARPSGACTLSACTVAPGFAFEDFAMLADCPDEAQRVRAAFPDLMGLV